MCGFTALQMKKNVSPEFSCPPKSGGTKEFTVSPRLHFSGLNPVCCYKPWPLRGHRDTIEHTDLCVCSEFPGSQVLHQAFASMTIVHPSHKLLSILQVERLRH